MIRQLVYLFEWHLGTIRLANSGIKDPIMVLKERFLHHFGPMSVRRGGQGGLLPPPLEKSLRTPIFEPFSK
jgi:hypothetical protein